MKNRNVHKLPPRLSDTLLSYAAAASAAGVGVLSLAVPAHAEVVYTATDIKISPGHVLDVDNDGIVDFLFFDFAFTNTLTRYPPSGVEVSPSPNHKYNRIAATSPYGDAAALHRGDQIGPSSLFKNSYASFGRALVICRDPGACGYPGGGSGPFGKARHGYLGLEFSINGSNHFGWARIIFPDGPQSGIITGYAYETTPNKPIRAGQTSGNEATTSTLAPSAVPEPATLGHLAQGARGMAAWRNPAQLSKTGSVN